MAEAAVKCPHCQSEEVVKYGKTSNGKERFRCQHRAECGRTFVGNYAYPGCLPTVKQQIVDMTLNGSGIRAIARVLHVGTNTVIRELKKCMVCLCESTVYLSESSERQPTAVMYPASVRDYLSPEP